MDTTRSLSVGQPPTGRAAEFKDCCTWVMGSAVLNLMAYQTSTSFSPGLSALWKSWFYLLFFCLKSLMRTVPPVKRTKLPSRTKKKPQMSAGFLLNIHTLAKVRKIQDTLLRPKQLKLWKRSQVLVYSQLLLYSLLLPYFSKKRKIKPLITEPIGVWRI